MVNLTVTPLSITNLQVCSDRFFSDWGIYRAKDLQHILKNENVLLQAGLHSSFIMFPDQSVHPSPSH